MNLQQGLSINTLKTNMTFIPNKLMIAIKIYHELVTMALNRDSKNIYDIHLITFTFFLQKPTN